MNFPEKWDLADPRPPGVTLRDLKKMLKAAVLVPKPKTLFDHVVSASDFVDLPIKPIEFLVGSWLTVASLLMIFAYRGVGKSWFAYWLAICLTRGEKFFAWAVTRKCRVLLVDGEMTNADIQKRLRLLAGKQIPAGLDILSSEALWLEGKPLNFNDTASQQQFQGMLDALVAAGRRPEVIILDNLSSLTSGTDENDNGAQDGLLHWLMGLRHQGFTVPFVHHAGKNGEQRGASRREDLLNTVIKLEAPKGVSEPAHGACFEITFTKTRGERPDPHTLLVEMSTSRGIAEWKVVQAVSQDVRILQMIHDHAPKSQNALAKLMSCASTTVGKKLAPLINKGLVQKTSTLISLTASGHDQLTPPKGPRF